MPTPATPKLFTIETTTHYNRVRCIICGASFSVNKGELNTLKAMDQMIGHALEHILKKGLECRIKFSPEFKNALHQSSESGNTDRTSTSTSAHTTPETQLTSSHTVTLKPDKSPPESEDSSLTSPRYDV